MATPCDPGDGGWGDDGWGKVHRRVTKDKRLKLDELRLYADIASYTNSDREAWPSTATLADDLGFDRRRVNRATKGLVGLGLLEVEQRMRKGKGGYTSNLYRLRPNGASPQVGGDASVVTQRTDAPVVTQGDAPVVTLADAPVVTQEQTRGSDHPEQTPLSGAEKGELKEVQGNPKTLNPKISRKGPKAKSKALAHLFTEAFEHALPGDPTCRKAGKKLAADFELGLLGPSPISGTGPALTPADVPDLVAAWTWSGREEEWLTAWAVANWDVKLWLSVQSMRAGKPPPHKRPRRFVFAGTSIGVGHADPPGEAADSEPEEAVEDA
jgi:hypothetical protein